jgi:hypothetical protein
MLSLQRLGSYDDHDVALSYWRSSGGTPLASGSWSQGRRRRRSSASVLNGSLSARERRGSCTVRATASSGVLHDPDEPHTHQSVAPSASGGAPRAPHRAGPLSAESEFELRATVSKLKTDEVSAEEARWLIKVLRTHFLFNALPMAQLLRLVRHLP